jgi:hypothetical protein
MLEIFLRIGKNLRNRILYDIYDNVDYYGFFKNKLDYNNELKNKNNKLLIKNGFN